MMKSRLFQEVALKMLIKSNEKEKEKESAQRDGIEPIRLPSLGGHDVISSQISDHHPIIHNKVLFWNMMMQGRERLSKDGPSFNNGFGIVESEQEYLTRLTRVANVIAEIITLHPSIIAINLCEGPIQPLHVNTLLSTLKHHQAMQRFFDDTVTLNNFYQAYEEGAFPNWGLLMLADNRYEVAPIENKFLVNSTVFEKVANRFQIWQLTNGADVRYVALAHFPFGGDEFKADKSKLSYFGEAYCNIINNVLISYADKELTFCADFNLNPYLIGKWADRAMDYVAHNNSIVITREASTHQSMTKEVTVDGILLSQYSKQRNVSSLQSRGLLNVLKRENRLAKQANESALITSSRKTNTV